MVVCRCRKATKVYCFVHKAPVCADCACFPEHRLCVVRTYSDWVIDGDYNWPPKCAACQVVLQDEDISITRLGCLHNFHSSCLCSHLENFPPQTAPAGYVCPTCYTAVWPPNKYFKDSGSILYSRIKEVVTQVTASKVLLGADAVAQSREAPPAFSSIPLAALSGSAIGAAEGEGIGSAAAVDADYSIGSESYHVEGCEGSVAAGSGMTQERSTRNWTGSGPTVGPTRISVISPDSRFSKPTSTPLPQVGATTRKHVIRVDKSYFGNHIGQHYRTDEDGISRKYSRRGPYRQILKYLPFVSSGLPSIPVSQLDEDDGKDAIDSGRRRLYRSSSMDVRKLILLFAVMSCMATAMLLYYRLAQGSGFWGEEEADEQ